MDVTVAVCTFGAPEWIALAQRAIASVQEQAPVVHVHGRTLADSRNQALAQVDTEWLVYLDADDQLESGYIDAMAVGSADLRAPTVRYVHGARPAGAIIPRVAGHRHACAADCLRDGNWLVIGTAARAELLRRVGGWRDFPWSEDWDLWLRCWRAGATVEAIPGAVYRAHVRSDSRNRAPDRAFKLAAHEAIHRANFPELYEQAA